jgi:hypothetical protein
MRKHSREMPDFFVFTKNDAGGFFFMNAKTLNLQ